MYDLSALTDALHAIQVRVHIETSGTHPITGAIDWICLSPKKFKAPLPENLPLAHEFKPVIYHASDFDWAESFRPQLSDACKLYLQVEWSKSETLMPKLVDYIQQQPAWTLSLQTHKFIHIP
jgi:organic radical activating enzyme